MSKVITLPKDIKRSLWNWAQKEQDEETPAAHITGIVCCRLTELTPDELSAFYDSIRTQNNWEARLEEIGPPRI